MHMKFIFFNFVPPTKFFPFKNHVFEFFFQRMVIEILFTNKKNLKFQIIHIYIYIYTLLKEIYE